MDQAEESTRPQDVVYDLTAHPQFSKNGLCFAARGSGLYQSNDGGRSWRSMYESLDPKEPITTTTVILSPDFDEDHNIFAGTVGGFLISSNGGDDWEIVALPSPPPVVSNLVVSPDFRRDGVVLAGTLEDGVFRSTDRAGHWASWNFGLLDLRTLDMAISPDFAQDETLFVGTETGLFRSTNGGRAWREVELPCGSQPITSIAISPLYNRDQSIFVGTETGELFHSQNRGADWSVLAEDSITGPVNKILLSPGFPSQPDILLIQSDLLLTSRDAGKSWEQQELDEILQAEATCVIAPKGLNPQAPLLIGTGDGMVIRIN
ncbi:MAG: hypothetical protein GTO18_10300 [Anaerolineales bacterium]|nr:hypothetical protein [Anaerolineales bacterium]